MDFIFGLVAIALLLIGFMAGRADRNGVDQRLNRQLKRECDGLRKRCEDTGLVYADLVEFWRNRYSGVTLPEPVPQMILEAEGRAYDSMALTFDRITRQVGNLGTSFTYPGDLEHGSDVILDLSTVGRDERREGVERRQGFTTSARDPEHFRRSGAKRRGRRKGPATRRLRSRLGHWHCLPLDWKPGRREGDRT